MAATFSATGNILSGSVTRPDFSQIFVWEDNKDHPENSSFVSKQREFSTWNHLLIIPVVGTVTGLCQAFLGLIHSIVHLAAAIFDSKNRAAHLQEARLGARNIAFGLGGAIPLIGTFCITFCLGKRIEKHEKQVLDELSKNLDHNQQAAILYEDGKEVARCAKASYNQDLPFSQAADIIKGTSQVK